MAAGVAENYFGIPVWEEKTCTRKKKYFQAFMVLR